MVSHLPKKLLQTAVTKPMSTRCNFHRLPQSQLTDTTIQMSWQGIYKYPLITGHFVIYYESTLLVHILVVHLTVNCQLSSIDFSHRSEENMLHDLR